MRKHYDATHFAEILGDSVNEIKRFHKTQHSSLMKGAHISSNYVYEVLHGRNEVSPAHYLIMARCLMMECYDVEALKGTLFRLVMGTIGFVLENDFQTLSPDEVRRQDKLEACRDALCKLTDEQQKCKLQFEKLQKYLEARENEVVKLVNQKIREQEAEQGLRTSHPNLLLTPAEGMMVNNLRVALERQKEIESLAATLHDKMELLQDRVNEYLDQYYSEPE